MNNITIELCAEDRARLDRLADLIEKQLPPTVVFNESVLAAPPKACPTEPQEEPKAEAEEISAPDITVEPEPAPVPEITPEKEEPAKVEPSVTLDQIQQKVVQLAAGFGGTKKPQVRAIISAYGSKVSDLKDQPEKWTEVWEKLVALESEG